HRPVVLEPGFDEVDLGVGEGCGERIVIDYSRLPDLLAPRPSDPAWPSDWDQLHLAGQQAVASAEAWSELSATRTVLDASRAVFLGASLPIRLADWVGADPTVRLGANRGASGIDGVVHTAIGAAGPVTSSTVRVLIGDLTCLHDQGSLPLLRAPGLQAVVFNNQGGSIFGMLPFRDVDGFDQVFRNAHTVRIAPLAQAHGLRTAEVADPDALAAALADPEVDFVEARFEHHRTMQALATLHRQTCAVLRATWGLT
ncbi:MAG: hypothetical protein AAF211_31765, partial [Myxococcota bacterium]